MIGKRLLLVGLPLVGILTLLIASLSAIGFISISGVGPRCTSDERAVYEELPQYGNRMVEPSSNEQFGGCFASYTKHPSGDTVQASQLEEVQGYYAKQLRERGWDLTLEPAPSDSKFAEPKGVRSTGEVPKGEGGDLIRAHRGEYRYHLIYAVEDTREASVYVQATVDKR